MTEVTDRIRVCYHCHCPTEEFYQLECRQPCKHDGSVYFVCVDCMDKLYEKVGKSGRS